MKTRAARLYGKEDLRLEEFELSAITADEILAKVVSDSICMSSYKAAKQATDHKRVPNDIAENPVIIGHKFGGELVEIGDDWKHIFKDGQKFSIQPAIYYEEGPVGVFSAPGYSYQYIGRLNAAAEATLTQCFYFILFKFNLLSRLYFYLSRLCYCNELKNNNLATSYKISYYRSNNS